MVTKECYTALYETSVFTLLGLNQRSYLWNVLEFFVVGAVIQESDLRKSGTAKVMERQINLVIAEEPPVITLDYLHSIEETDFSVAIFVFGHSLRTT